MKIAKVIGTVTLSRSHPQMQASTLRLVETVERAEQINQPELGTESQVAWDLCGAGLGDWVAMAEGPEAAAPFRPQVKPIDASLVAILDHIDVSFSRST